MAKYGTFLTLDSGQNPGIIRGMNNPNKRPLIDVLTDIHEKIKSNNQKIADYKAEELYRGRGMGHAIGPLERENAKLHKLIEAVKKDYGIENPQKFWVMDTDVRPWAVKHETANEEMAQRVVDRLNGKAGRERYQVLGFGVENPETKWFVTYFKGNGTRPITEVYATETSAKEG